MNTPKNVFLLFLPFLLVLSRSCPARSNMIQKSNNNHKPTHPEIPPNAATQISSEHNQYTPNYAAVAAATCDLILHDEVSALRARSYTQSDTQRTN